MLEEVFTLPHLFRSDSGQIQIEIFASQIGRFQAILSESSLTPSYEIPIGMSYSPRTFRSYWTKIEMMDFWNILFLIIVLCASSENICTGGIRTHAREQAGRT